MASVSVGDIVLCSQIIYRLLEATTTGRKNALRDIGELDNVLLTLNLSLDRLCKVTADVTSRDTSLDPDAVYIKQNLGFMIRSCRQTLESLENSTSKYRDITKPSTPGRDVGSRVRYRLFRWKSQWRTVMWDFKGESLTRYRKKLETHTTAINVMLSTCIWSTTNRIEIESRRQGQRLEELFHQASQLNTRVSTLLQSPPYISDASHDFLEPRLLYPQPSVTPRPT